MYELFGAREVDSTGQIRFRLFVPDKALDPGQYTSGKLPGIATVQVIGSFQAELGSAAWLVDPAFEMTKTQFTDGKTKGWLYELTTAAVPAGFYEYKYRVTYTSGTSPRFICDPCTHYGGVSDQNSGVVVGGPKMTTKALASPKKLEKLILYELMIDDFTALIGGGSKAPLTIVRENLDHIKKLGVNALQIMPWTQWPGENYNWGYEPQGYFAVAFRYTLNPTDPSEKLFLLKRLISDCHDAGIHIIFDAVFGHVSGVGSDRGFGYHWLWDNPADSPYTGSFAGGGYGIDLDFDNGCVEDFIFDVCRYWIEEFEVDGIRLDYTDGIYLPHSHRGLPNLLTRLKAWLASKGKTTFPLILEHKWDYTSIDVVNKVGATSCWLDPFRGLTREYLSARHVKPGIMRFLDSARDFGPGKTPVTYIENHDHENLALNAGGRDEWWRMQPYMIALMTASGAPMFHNGQEFGEIYPMPEPFKEDPTAPASSQNPARKRVVPRPLNWSYLNDGPGSSLFGLFKNLIEIRKNHAGLTSPGFHPSGWNESYTQLDPDGFGIDEGRQVVVYHRYGKAEDGHLEKFYIVLNFSPSPQWVDMTFPEDGGWTDLLSGWNPPVSGNHLRVEVGSNWGHVFYKKY